ncbi:phosphoribosyl-AMP cyclohydrolase [Morganella morganii]|uniref:phosphoribosyl-AMP cyclohydrolase n=1 Tax=Morganella morganii TaxID=582 RepID=UPI00128E74F0|nr:phosphoribosyl-AMP cyclohydrolase [Morganella morganii]MQC07064.1 phosphoribosyl-AMP cyclohydrolase [Morganella morganii]MQC12351.1 phosphoribosyl-AMP cyclohydrolase [Morganella morganii]MQC15195.1 phosphoribosyl-AMP cyclohydrolase [Morganella morganii]
MFLLLEKAHAGVVFKLEDILASIPWDSHGLIAAIAQQYDTGEVLMLAWMNQQALDETLLTGSACYWPRSRSCLWRKGETSGCVQQVYGIRLDYDGDALLLLVDQKGGACHTGRQSCFYNVIKGDELTVLNDPG